MSENPQGRVFPPLYKSSGDPVADRLAFFHILERLKVCSNHLSTTLILSRPVSQTQKRTGWVDNKVIVVLGSY
jgi:putative hydrolase of HD superfamily